MRFLLVLVATAAALAGIYLGTEIAGSSELAEPNDAVARNDEEAPRFATPDIFVYPLQSGNALGGYLVMRFALPLERLADDTVVLPDDAVLADAFYASVFSLRTSPENPDVLPPLQALSDKFVAAANLNAGSRRFNAALLQQFDVFDPKAMRRKNVRERDAAEQTLPPNPLSKL
jgi:hypothetical protein